MGLYMCSDKLSSCSVCMGNLLNVDIDSRYLATLQEIMRFEYNISSILNFWISNFRQYRKVVRILNLQGERYLWDIPNLDYVYQRPGAINLQAHFNENSIFKSFTINFRQKAMYKLFRA